MLCAQLHFFDHLPFSGDSVHTSIVGSYFVLLIKTADSTIQGNDLRLNFCIFHKYILSSFFSCTNTRKSLPTELTNLLAFIKGNVVFCCFEKKP